MNYVKQRFLKQSNDLVELCCVIKPLISWNAERVGSVCRERAGGQGYVAINVFGSVIGFAHSGITAEGDNSVLMQKVSINLFVGIKGIVRKKGRIYQGNRITGI